MIFAGVVHRRVGAHTTFVAQCDLFYDWRYVWSDLDHRVRWVGSVAQITWTTYLIGAVGLFGYPAIYFSTLRMAPATEKAISPRPG